MLTPNQDGAKNGVNARIWKFHKHHPGIHSDWRNDRCPFSPYSRACSRAMGSFRMSRTAILSATHSAEFRHPSLTISLCIERVGVFRTCALYNLRGGDFVGCCIGCLGRFGSHLAPHLCR